MPAATAQTHAGRRAAGSRRTRARTGRRAAGAAPAALPWSALGAGRHRAGQDGEPVFVVVAPRAFDETPQAVRALQEGANVVLNLANLPTCVRSRRAIGRATLPRSLLTHTNTNTRLDEQQRAVDFVAGACHALWGHQETLSDTMFLFTPAETRVRSFTDTEDPFA